MNFSLEQIMGGKPLPVKETRQVAIEIGKALDHMHQMRIVHHDVKAANIMIVYIGNRFVHKLIDLGLAREYHQGTRHNASLAPRLSIIGTEWYVPDEMTNDNPWHYRTWNPFLSDSYAFGVTLAMAALGKAGLKKVMAAREESRNPAMRKLQSDFEEALIVNKPPNRLWQAIANLHWPFDCSKRLHIDVFLQVIDQLSQVQASPSL